VRMGGIILPTPSKASVFLDEAANSIDNNVLGIDPPVLDPSHTTLDPSPSGAGFWNLPASRHNNGCTLSFADGHAEHWKWLGSAILSCNAIYDSEGPGTTSFPAQSSIYFQCSWNDPDLDRLELTVPVFNP